MSIEVSRLKRHTHTHIKRTAQTTQGSRGQVHREENQKRAHNNIQCVRYELKLYAEY